MMKIYDGREFFYQWDLSQKITSDAFEVGDKIHFFNIRQTNALVVSAYELDGKVVADVPNILLQTAIPIKVWKYVHGENSAQTVMEDTFKVEQRAQPYDYFYTETELYELRKVVEDTATRAESAVAQLSTGLENAERAIELATAAEKTSTENEQNRVDAEENRILAESKRIDAENERLEAEITRLKNESDRLDAEAKRVAAEQSRVDMENKRDSFELGRENAEYARHLAEITRQESESKRENAEESRTSAEYWRNLRETERTNAETARNEAESQRVIAEQSRVEAEAQRETAEQNRVAAEELRQANFKSSQNNISNAVKGYASGEVVRVDDVSPIEHIASVKVSGKNLWNTLVIESTSAITVNADGTITVGGGKYYCPTGKTVSQVCPSLKIGDIVAFSINTNGAPYIYLSGSNVGGVSNKKTLTVTDDILSSEVVLYGAEQSAEDYNEPRTISSIQIEKGDTATEYEPYIDPTTVTVTRYGANETDNPQTYIPSTDGTCEVVSVSPTMTLLTDTAGANIEVEYNQDTNAAMGNVRNDLQTLDNVTAELIANMGDVETALDGIIAIQNSLIGGDSE